MPAGQAGPPYNGQGAVMGPAGAILFDVGDTLLGFPVPSWEEVDRASARALREALTRPLADGRRLEGPPPEEARLLEAFRQAVREWEARTVPRLLEMPAREVLRTALAHLGIDVSEAALNGLERAWAAPRLAIRRVFPEVPGVLAQLQAAGVRLGLISNIWISGAIVREHLDALGLLRPFECVVLSSEVGLVKPHPTLFRVALDRLGLPADRAWYVGDNPHADVAGAKAVGMGAVLVRRPPDRLLAPPPPADPPPYGGPPPDLVVADLREVLAAVEAGGSPPHGAG